MLYQWINQERTILAVTQDDGHVIVVEPGHHRWGEFASGDGIIPFDPETIQTPVPRSVTRRQARQALLLSGKLAQVQPAIDSIPDPIQRGMIQIEWDDSQTFERNRPALIALATAIGLDSPQIDNLFIEASKL
jgi:hypothetical protein